MSLSPSLSLSFCLFYPLLYSLKVAAHSTPVRDNLFAKVVLVQLINDEIGTKNKETNIKK